VNRAARNRLIVGDAHQRLQQLQDASVDMVLTSPPYYLLRNYQVSGQLGLESHVDEWASNLRAVARELHRVLLPTASLWLNLGDTYAIHPRQGAPRKSLLLGPERVALALLEDGWLLRNKIVWAKSNPMPSSVRDRLTCTWEAIYVFTRQPRYFFDLDAIRTPHTTSHRGRLKRELQRPPREAWRGPNGDDASGLDVLKARGIIGHPLGKNPGDVWTLASSNYRGAHHATFPLTLARRAIQAGSPEARCVRCRAPWRRQFIRSIGGTAVRGALGPTCDCQAPREPAVVLDPFLGAGTTAIAAEQLGRDWLGIELNPDFARLARRRIQDARAGPAARHAA
jgi:site-specific DNA-methyltransferase (adenine-specific)